METAPPESNQPYDVGRVVGTEPGDRVVLKFGRIDIPLRWCPPGKLRMGSPKTDAMRFDGEDQVDVTLTKGFWLMETPVTQGLWQAVTGEKLRWSREYGRGPDHPAYDPDWNMANDFAAKLTHKLVSSGQLPNDLKLSLPTEAQWEYACRAGTSTRFPFVEYPAALKNHAWFGDNSGSRAIDAQAIWDADPKAESYTKKMLENGCKSHPVGRKIANDWGLHDMLGNIIEWCADSYVEKLPGGIDPLVSGGAGSRVRRGGSWGGLARDCRPARRNWWDLGSRFVSVGFRLAAVL